MVLEYSFVPVLGHSSVCENGVLHRDISVGNVLISEDESEGFLIDLDHAIRVDRAENSGAPGRTGTKAFMSIGLLRQHEGHQTEPHSFMDDLESMFWVLFWICVHYSGPNTKQICRSEYEEWNYLSPSHLGTLKAGLITDEADFLTSMRVDFTNFYKPLVPVVNELRKTVFLEGKRWKSENLALYGDMKKVLLEAMNNEPTVD